MTAAVAEFFDQPSTRDGRDLWPSGASTFASCVSPSVVRTLTIAPLTEVIEQAGRALGDRERNCIPQAPRRDVLELHVPVHQTFGDAKWNAVRGRRRVVGPPTLVERLAPRTQLAMRDDLDIRDGRCIQSSDAGGSLDEGVDVVAGGPRLNSTSFSRIFRRALRSALSGRIRRHRSWGRGPPAHRRYRSPLRALLLNSAASTPAIGKGAVDRLGRRIAGQHDLARARHLHQGQPSALRICPRRDRARGRRPLPRRNSSELTGQKLFAWPPAGTRDRGRDAGGYLASNRRRGQEFAAGQAADRFRHRQRRGQTNHADMSDLRADRIVVQCMHQGAVGKCGVRRRNLAAVPMIVPRAARRGRSSTRPSRGSRRRALLPRWRSRADPESSA